MTIEQAGLLLEEIDEDSFEEEDSGLGTEYNMRELMDQVYKLKDCIITVPKDQEKLLRQGLIVRKSRDNGKMKTSGLTGSTDVLSFLSYPAKDADGKDSETIVDVRVKLGPKKSVTVIDIRVPNDEF